MMRWRHLYVQQIVKIGFLKGTAQCPSIIGVSKGVIAKGASVAEGLCNATICYKSQWSSGYRTPLWCERTEVRISPRAVVFIATAAAIYSLGHGLQTFTAVPRSTQPFSLHGTVIITNGDGECGW